jgi:hypothetical protein
MIKHFYNISTIFVLLLIISFHPAVGQVNINFRDYFFPPSATTYTIKLVNEKDNNAYLLKKIKTLGKDSMEVADYNPENQFLQSLVFVLKNDSILVNSGRSVLDSAIYNSEITAHVWAMATVKGKNKIHFATSTTDNCFIHKSDCYWRWFRHRQTGLKMGKYSWRGETVKIITIKFEENELFQPVTFSSISGTNTYTVSYTFAQGIGLIKIEKKLKQFSFSTTLIRLQE